MSIEGSFDKIRNKIRENNRNNNKDNYFPLEKILSVDKDSYLRSVEKTDRDYKFQGKTVEGEAAYLLTETFRAEVPKNTEAVVNVLRFLYRDEGRQLGNMYGTALIPKIAARGHKQSKLNGEDA